MRRSQRVRSRFSVQSAHIDKKKRRSQPINELRSGKGKARPSLNLNGFPMISKVFRWKFVEKSIKDAPIKFMILFFQINFFKFAQNRRKNESHLTGGRGRATVYNYFFCWKPNYFFQSDLSSYRQIFNRKNRVKTKKYKKKCSQHSVISKFHGSGSIARVGT